MKIEIEPKEQRKIRPIWIFYNKQHTRATLREKIIKCGYIRESERTKIARSQERDTDFMRIASTREVLVLNSSYVRNKLYVRDKLFIPSYRVLYTLVEFHI